MSDEALLAARSWRVIGVVLTADGRAIDIALVETDGGQLVRRIEAGRWPLPAPADGRADLAARLGAEILTFMGDRALQPFAVDRVAISGAEAAAVADALARIVEVEVSVIEGMQPAPARARTFARAEQVALLAVESFHLHATR